MTEREQSRDERRKAEPDPGPPLTADTADVADVADVIEQSSALGPEDGEEEESGGRTESWERGEASDADAADQLRSVTDPEEDYR